MPIYSDYFERFCPKEHCKEYRKTWNQVEKVKIVPEIDYADD
jgi:hypothetical protein